VYAGQTASLTFKQDRRLNRTAIAGTALGEVEEWVRRRSRLVISYRTIIPENQCVFVRTMNFTLSGKIWYDFSSQATCAAWAFVRPRRFGVS
jgi:hypothetical protein